MLDRQTKNRYTVWTLSKFREALYDMKDYYHSSIGHVRATSLAGEWGGGVVAF